VDGGRESAERERSEAHPSDAIPIARRRARKVTVERDMVLFVSEDSEMK
jgi:hypothetical protein